MGLHTLAVGDEYIPLPFDQGAILRELAAASEPLTQPQLFRQVYPADEPDGAHRMQGFRGRIREMADSVNAALGHSAITDIRIGTALYFRLEPSAGITVDASVKTAEELRAIFTEEDMYGGIVDISGLGLSTEISERSTIIKIVSDDSIQIAGRERRLRGHVLYLFNALLVSRGYSTAKELKSFGFRRPSPQDFNKSALTPLRRYLNGGGEDSFRGVLLSTPNRIRRSWSILHALSPRVVVIKVES